MARITRYPRVSLTVTSRDREGTGRSLRSPCPRQDSNLRTTLRRRVLYPLSYGGSGDHSRIVPRFGLKSAPGRGKPVRFL
jgi:hypothetical protein